jgi:hypothetical protein
MHTLFDFITHVKGIEYILSIMFIAGFLLFWEVLKTMPFHGMTNQARKALDYMRRSGKQHTIAKFATAAFLVVTYIVSLPFVFAYAVLSAVKNGFTHGAPGE